MVRIDSAHQGVSEGEHEFLGEPTRDQDQKNCYKSNNEKKRRVVRFGL
jgi:hypothetical protein